MLKSISSKLITLFICVTSLVFLITSIMFMYLFSSYAYNEKEELLVNSASSIADFAADQLKATDGDDFSFDLRYFADSVLDASVWICDGNGFFRTDLGSSGPQTADQLTDEEYVIIMNAMSTGDVKVTEEFSDTFGEDFLSACAPILISVEELNALNSAAEEDGGVGETGSDILDNEGPFSQRITVDGKEYVTKGLVIIHSPLTDINDYYIKAQIFLLIALIVGIAVAAAVAIAFSLRFTRPIKTMRKAASRIAAGDYDVRVQLEDKSELSELAYGLNHLASTTGSTVTKLKNETLKLSNIINNVTDGLAAYDTSLRLMTYNAALLKICKEDYFQRPEIKDALIQVMKDGQVRTVILEEQNDILRFTFTQIKTNDVVEGAVVIVSDISQSEKLERLRREFVANVSHEFRTPLTIIQGSVEVLLDGAVTEPEEVQRFHERIATEASALERLVRDLLDTSRFKAGKIKLKPTRVNGVELLTSLTDSLVPVAKEKGIHLVYEHSELPDFWADYDRLRQLIIIFIDNAIKFTSEGGYITVSTYQKDNMGYICFKDTGVGINPEEIPFIFERFYKVDKARGGSETGTGLGLSIAGQIVQLHGGKINVESDVGKGTTFKVMLPLYDGQDQIPTEEAE